MRATAQKRAVKISPEDLELLAWLRENRDALQVLLFKPIELVHLGQAGFYGKPCTREPGHFGLCNGLSRQDCARVSPVEAYLPESLGLDSVEVETLSKGEIFDRAINSDSISDASRCSVCLSPILDLDAPCPTCVESGRLQPIPQAGHGQDIAELQQARESAPKLEPAPVITTEPRISQAINRAPIPPPLPPLRAYNAGETCRNCGRLPELHQDHGGPIGHNHESQMRFFVGLHQPSDAKHFDAAFISVNRIRTRKSNFAVGDWIMDSGAFSTILQHGGYPHPVEEYASHIRRWRSNGTLLAAVAQDYMCEPAMLAKTSLSIADHQRLTIERYDDLLRCETGCYIMPVLQGYAPEDYVSHIRQYGSRLAHGAWVGVGSVCKRNGDVSAILDVLLAIKLFRPDLQLHGFGLKTIALAHGVIRALLHTADSMAWSFAARMDHSGANDWRNAAKFKARIGEPIYYQSHLIEQLT